MSQKDEKVSLSDQITSRLHRWVQRTTSKVRNERAHNVKIEENQNILEVNELNEKKCLPRERFERRSRESRSYEELEKALKDLIDNCVTNDSAIQERSSVTHDTTNINITRENNNYSESSLSNKTNNDIESEEMENSNNIEVIDSPSGSDCLQETGDNDLGRILKSLSQTQLHSPPHCQSKQTGIFLSGERRNKAVDDFKDDESDVSVNTSKENENDCDPETRSNGHFNNLSNSSDTCAINTSFGKVNKGLNPPIDGSSLNERRVETSSRSLKKKPPLRRIQSEGDALELKLSFFDSDVTEFAATCVRHAQKKRFSDVTPDAHRTVQLPGFLTGEATKSRKCSIPEDEVSVSTDEGRPDLLEESIPQISLHETDDEGNETNSEHISLSARPSSLSFPLETSKWENKASSLKPRVSSSLPRSIPSPSRLLPNTTSSAPTSSLSNPSSSRSSPSSSLSNPSSSRSSPSSSRSSPKFRRFPYQPVFYVPKPSESRTIPKAGRSGSVGEQPREYLI